MSLSSSSAASSACASPLSVSAAPVTPGSPPAVLVLLTAPYVFPPCLDQFFDSAGDFSTRYERQGVIGTGAYGTVFKAAQRGRSPSRPVALKQLNSSREGFGIPLDAYRELKLLRELRHDNIVSLDSAHLRPVERELTLVYQYSDFDLNDLIRYHRVQGVNIDQRIVKSIMHQLLTGLAFLHSNWVIHRDLKPQNLLISTSASSNAGSEGQLKIADWGLCRTFRFPLRKLSDDGPVVTLWYRSFELLLGSKHYGPPIDCWASGCIFFELLTNSPLFPGEETKHKFEEPQVKKICQLLGKPTVDQWPQLNDLPYASKLSSWPSDEYRFSLSDRLPGSAESSQFDLLRRLLHYDPNQRLSAEAALQHPYFKESPLPHSNCFVKSNQSILQMPQRQVKPLSRQSNQKNSNAANKRQRNQSNTQQEDSKKKSRPAK